MKYKILKKINKIIYYCIACNRDTSVLHEIFFGISRQRCIEFCIQVPLCQICHNIAHGKESSYKSHLSYQHSLIAKLDQDECKRYFCDKLNVDYDRVRFSIRNGDDDKYLYKQKPFLEDKIQSYIKECL